MGIDQLCERKNTNLYFPPKTVLAACYYNIPSVKKTEFIAENYHRLASSHLPQGQRDTKIILMMPRLSPCLWSKGRLLQRKKTSKVWPKNPFIPSSQGLHSELATALCWGKFVLWCVQEGISAGEVETQRNSGTVLQLQLPGGKNYPWDTKKTKKNPQTQKNLGDMGTLFASKNNQTPQTSYLHKSFP